jgi:hypothetical protein
VAKKADSIYCQGERTTALAENQAAGGGAAPTLRTLACPPLALFH